MMPTLVKGDDIRSGTKADAHHGRLRSTRESMSSVAWAVHMNEIHAT